MVMPMMIIIGGIVAGLQQAELQANARAAGLVSCR
jgi:hypothetical protein